MKNQTTKKPTRRKKYTFLYVCKSCGIKKKLEIKKPFNQDEVFGIVSEIVRNRVEIDLENNEKIFPAIPCICSDEVFGVADFASAVPTKRLIEG